MTQAQQQIFAELIEMQITMQRRLGQVTCVFNPSITVDTQIVIFERVTGDANVHYVKAVHTEHDLDSGKHTMTLTTVWFGTPENWAIGYDASYCPISDAMVTYLAAIQSVKTDSFRGVTTTGQPPVLPGPATNVTAYAAQGAATVTWALSTSAGWAAEYRIVGYSNGAQATGTIVVPNAVAFATFVNLTNGVSYYFVVYADSVAGSTPSAQSNTITPTATSAPLVVQSTSVPAAAPAVAGLVTS